MYRKFTPVGDWRLKGLIRARLCVSQFRHWRYCDTFPFPPAIVDVYFRFWLPYTWFSDERENDWFVSSPITHVKRCHLTGKYTGGRDKFTPAWRIFRVGTLGLFFSKRYGFELSRGRASFCAIDIQNRPKTLMSTRKSWSKSINKIWTKWPKKWAKNGVK